MGDPPSEGAGQCKSKQMFSFESLAASLSSLKCTWRSKTPVYTALGPPGRSKSCSNMLLSHRGTQSGRSSALLRHRGGQNHCSSLNHRGASKSIQRSCAKGGSLWCTWPCVARLCSLGRSSKFMFRLKIIYFPRAKMNPHASKPG